MPSIINLSPIWEHTPTEILNHGNKTEMGIIMRSCVKHNSLEDMNDLLLHDLNDFTPTGSLSQYKVSEEQYLQFWATLDDGQVWSSKISAY